MAQNHAQLIVPICIGSCILFVIYLIYRIFISTSSNANSNCSKYNNFKGPKGCPFLGNCLEFLLVDSSEWLKVHKGWHNKFGSRYRIFLGNRAYIAFTNAADIQKVISTTSHNDKSKDYNLVMPWLGEGLLTSRGQKWFHRRKLLTSAFHYKILEDFIEVFNEQSLTLVSVLKSEFEDGKIFNIFPYITRCALDTICETAMGKKLNAQKERNNKYANAVYRLSELIQHRMVRPWLHPNLLWKMSPSGQEEKQLLKILHGFAELVISERKMKHLNKANSSKNSHIYQTKGKSRVAFLDLLVTAQMETGLLSDLDIREETDTILFEGHDSVAASLNWTIFLLGCNPECQEKVHEEINEIFGNDKQRSVTMADINRLKYLDCCIKESLRLYPSVPFIGRAINEDLELDDETTIQAGTTAFIMPYQLHRDETHFPDPEAFLPDRFFPHNVMGRNPFAYVPFSAGPRNCIGQRFAMMEEKVVLANFFRNFKVEAAEKREDLILLAELIMRPKFGFHVKLKTI